MLACRWSFGIGDGIEDEDGIGTGAILCSWPRALRVRFDELAGRACLECKLLCTESRVGNYFYKRVTGELAATPIC